jgi:hypothetical protein
MCTGVSSGGWREEWKAAGPGLEFKNSSPPSAEKKWSYASTPPYNFMAYTATTLSFTDNFYTKNVEANVVTPSNRLESWNV